MDGDGFVRHLIYSAGVSPLFRDFALRWKLILSYLLTDQMFAISQAPNEDQRRLSVSDLPWYYFGSGFCTWIFWQVSCAFGGVSGRLIPNEWNLGFSIPLIFMPLLFAVSTHKAAYLTAILAAVGVMLLRSLPYGLVLLYLLQWGL